MMFYTLVVRQSVKQKIPYIELHSINIHKDPKQNKNISITNILLDIWELNFKSDGLSMKKHSLSDDLGNCALRSQLAGVSFKNVNSIQ